MMALLIVAAGAADATLVMAATVGMRAAAIAVLDARRRRQATRRPLRSRSAEMRGFIAQAIPGWLQFRTAIADCRRRHDRLVSPGAGVLALFRQPADRFAARLGRHRDGHCLDAGLDTRRAQRRSDFACAGQSRALEFARWPGFARRARTVRARSRSCASCSSAAPSPPSIPRPRRCLARLRSACPVMFWSRHCRRSSSRARTPPRRCSRRSGLCGRDVSAVVLVDIFGAAGIAAAHCARRLVLALALIRRGAATFDFSIDADARRRLPRIVVAAI